MKVSELTNNTENSTSTQKQPGKFATYFGMAAPYNFSIALPALFGFFLLGCVTILAVGMAATDRLSFGAPRSYFFIYLFALLFLALILVKKPKVSWTLLVLVFIEFFLAFIPYFLNRLGLSLNANLLPAAANSRFEYHPLLQGVPKPGYSGTLPDGGILTHTDFGTRGPQPSADVLNSGILINAFGGSTTYDVAVSDEQSWPNQLGTLLGSNVAVINRGVPAYTSADNLIQTMFYDQVNNRTPPCALYYEGWNDARNAHIPTPDGAYADTHVLSLVNELQVRKGAGITPLMTLLSQMPVIGQDTVPLPTGYPNIPVTGNQDPVLEERFRKNIQSIIAVNNSKNVKSVFIGQILNSTALVGDTPGLIPNVPKGEVIKFISGLNSIMKEEALKAGATYVDANQSSFVATDFVDEGHFSPVGSAKFAQNISAQVQSACLAGN